MIDHLKLALFVIQCCIGIWDLWQPQDILLHRTHKSVRSLHQDHHMELLQQNKTYFIYYLFFYFYFLFFIYLLSIYYYYYFFFMMFERKQPPSKQIDIKSWYLLYMLNVFRVNKNEHK